MTRTKPQINIDVDFTCDGSDNASTTCGWVRATEILLKAKLRRDNISVDIQGAELSDLDIAI